MTKLNIYTVKGTKKSAGMNLPKKFDEKENLGLLAQAIRVYENRVHANASVTKRRGDIKASKRKIYAQKGTGRARHGAISAPIFVGGSKAHGPDGKRKVLNLPKKMARKALSVALSMKIKHNELIVVEGLGTIKKTKDAAVLLKKLLKSVKKDESTNVTVALSEKNKKSLLYMRNIKAVTVEQFSHLNAYKVSSAAVLIVDKDALSEKKATVSENKKSKK